MKFVLVFQGKTYDCEWFDSVDFSELEKERIIQAHGFIFDENNNVCLVDCDGKGKYVLPGGKPEPNDKSYEDTLKREVDEEADLEIKEIKPIGHIKVIPRDNKEKIHYSLRYIAKVHNKKQQTTDPAKGRIPSRMFIHVDEFDSYTGWGENGIFQLKKALNAKNKG